MGSEPFEGSPGVESPGNGSGSADVPVPAPAPGPAASEYHAEPRERGTHEAPVLAHFEPPPKHDESKPYVVWSSAPSDRDSGPPEE